MTPNKTVNTTMMAALMLGVFTTGCAMQAPNAPATKAMEIQNSAAAIDDAQGPAIAQTVGAEVQGVKNSYNDKSNKSAKSHKTKKSAKSNKSGKSAKSKKSHKSHKSGKSMSSKGQYNPYGY
jgi:hypothetical protein